MTNNHASGPIRRQSHSKRVNVSGYKVIPSATERPYCRVNSIIFIDISASLRKLPTRDVCEMIVSCIAEAHGIPKITPIITESPTNTRISVNAPIINGGILTISVHFAIGYPYVCRLSHRGLISDEKIWGILTSIIDKYTDKTLASLMSNLKI